MQTECRAVDFDDARPRAPHLSPATADLVRSFRTRWLLRGRSAWRPEANDRSMAIKPGDGIPADPAANEAHVQLWCKHFAIAVPVVFVTDV